MVGTACLAFPEMSNINELPPRPFSAAPTRSRRYAGPWTEIGSTFASKPAGLDAVAMRRTLGPSTMTRSGLVQRLVLVEHHYFTYHLHDRDYPPV